MRSAGLLIDGSDYYRAFYSAAQRARRYILLSGWQFDSDACLLRGEEAEGAPAPVTLLKFLDSLCARTPELQIYILAWDFHVVFAIEREWLQKIVFEWTTSERLRFRFDSSHVDKGCHHQKFAVIDGELSFLGGLDLCNDRWDTRSHLEKNPLRLSRGEPHKPFHDVQAYLQGPEVSGSLAELFTARWSAAGGEPIELPEPTGATFDGDFAPEDAVPLASGTVALSRTDPRGAPTRTEGCREICDLYLDAIALAERSIYIETQYFSSREVSEALIRRLRRGGGPPLQVVIVLNMRAETLKEEAAVGLAQAKIIDDLRKAAVGTGHALGIYYTVPAHEGEGDPPRATYIHSKVMIVDDRFFNVGSANLTNRSCAIDTELNASFETEDPGDALGRSICAARLGLMAEHLGVADLACGADVVAELDDRATRRDGRLRIHPSPDEKQRAVLAVIDPQALPFDPDAIEEEEEDRSIFTHGLGALWRRLVSDRDDRK
ncbi:phospholipase D-like domain-containing protein [Sorangium sp. So ce260]|uniref:phospholipase D-like domain-containing protein n=1 Tax=Sorangium sp. So ce260 TaxID=3133291 RepID=UPI003F5E8870